ncbi:MAG: diguanylate cyclase [Candidatus Omnitrophota bacterium]
MEQAQILLIEDNKESVEFISNTLKQNNYSVWMSEDINEAMELLRQRKFGVVLTEMRISSVDGRQLVREIKKVNPSASIVVITPYNLISEAIGMMEEGAFGYVTKPFNVSEIRIVMEHALEEFYLRGEAGEKTYYHQLSLVDGLTGLYNHKHLYDVLQKELTDLKAHPQNLSLLMLDIDNFKKYNDTYGHQAGDTVLKDLAGLISRSIRTGDMAFRYGGEEFAIYFPGTQKQNIVIVAERILNLARLHLPTTVSIGLASFPVDADNPEDLISKADKALYEAKRAGKDRLCTA